jgi:hypothetical protein
MPPEELRPAGHPTPPASAQRTAVSPVLRGVGSFTGESDYEVAFSLACPGASVLSAEQWGRAVFEEAPRALRWFLIVGWTAITCRLRPRRAPTRVLGWDIESAAPGTLVTVVHAWVGLTSRLVVSVESDLVTVATFVRYTRPSTLAARVVWAATIPLHERILPYLLTSAARRQCA